MTPFETLYGYSLPQLCILQDRFSTEPGVQKFIQDRKAAVELIRARLVEAQNIMKFFADKHQSEREFQPGDWVFLSFQPYRQTSLLMRRDHKLASKFYGPFKVVARVRKVAYKLELPPTSTIHLIFHVSMIKRKLGNQQALMPQLPPFNFNVSSWLNQFRSSTG